MKLHIIGIAGSGKTTFADWASTTFNIPAIDLDPVVFSQAGERPRDELLRRLGEIQSRDAWITEGAYHDEWVSVLLDDADAIVWLDVPRWASLWRILKRHVRAELQGNNKHAGWRKLWRFMSYTARTGASQREATVTLLRPYQEKVARCRSSADVTFAKSMLVQQVRAS